MENHELTIWSTPRNLETDENSSMEGRVVVTVPEGWTLERVDIKNGMGAVELDSLEEGDAFDLQNELKERLEDAGRKIKFHSSFLVAGAVLEIAAVIALAGTVVWLIS